MVGKKESSDDQAKSDKAAQRAEEAQSRTEYAAERTELADERTHQAEDRTQWAQHRTLLSNERTFTAWLRSGISAIAGGLVVAELLGGEDGDPLAQMLGVILIVLGMGFLIQAMWRYLQVSTVLEAEGLPTTPRWVAITMVGGLLLGAPLVLMLILNQ